MSTKETVVKSIQELPDDATMDDIIERVYFLAKLEHRLAMADSDDAKKLSQREVRERAQRWQQ